MHHGLLQLEADAAASKAAPKLAVVAALEELGLLLGLQAAHAAGAKGSVAHALHGLAGAAHHQASACCASSLQHQVFQRNAGNALAALAGEVQLLGHGLLSRSAARPPPRRSPGAQQAGSGRQERPGWPWLRKRAQEERKSAGGSQLLCCLSQKTTGRMMFRARGQRKRARDRTEDGSPVACVNTARGVGRQAPRGLALSISSGHLRTSSGQIRTSPDKFGHSYIPNFSIHISGFLGFLIKSKLRI